MNPGAVRIRIDLAYDGAPFAGFARQPEVTTVQGTLEEALERLVGIPVDTTCAGRTDRGVHAVAQVVHFDLHAAAGPRVARFLEDFGATRDRMASLCGDAIAVWAVRQVDHDFDARFSATGRAYRYRLVDAPTVDPRLRGLRWQAPGPLDVDAMRSGAAALIGEHDFASFCRRAPGRHTVRRVDEIAVERTGEEIHVRLAGPAFCHQQVRSIVGALVEVGRGRRPADWIAGILAARDRSVAAAVAPPHGLTLERVTYPAPYPDAPPPDARSAPR